MLRFHFFSFLMLAVAAVSAADRPNIVFVLADDMGHGDLGCTGCTDIATPNIDRIAAEGMRFTDFYSNAPVCTPTRCGFMLGRWQQRVGIEWAFGYTVEQMKKVNGEWVKVEDIHGLGMPLEEITLADRLKELGYVCGAFGKWHLGYEDPYNPVNRGFDEYFGELLGHADYYRHAYYDGTYALRDGLEPVKKEGYLTDLINERAAAFVKKHAGGDKPFFLYVPHLAVHAPFQPPDAPDTPMVTKENMLHGSRAIYKAMLERVDRGVGMILDELDRAGVADNTLVVFSSDNGGERWASNLPLFHHKATVWEGGIRVPCLMRWPAQLPAGKVTDLPAITMDLSATFVKVAGGELPQDKPFDGVNLMPLLLGQEQPVDRTFCWRIQRSNRLMKAVRHGKWKYVNDGNTMDLLFDLEQDIGERRNLNYTYPEITEQLKRRLADWEAEMDQSEKTILVR
ncbi:MAG: sulfatase-like hydrolase/transferase [Verrucomicrobiales bacterium]|nr:sulfatase-like hydrolase/transferase [Verrucomicrobiales bacterium]